MSKKGIKLGLKITGIFLLAVFALLLVLPLFFQKQMVNIALRQANKMLNAEFSMGDFHLSLIRNFPNPTLRMEDVIVKNKGAFEGDTLVKIGKFDACFNLMSLLSARKNSASAKRIFAKFYTEGFDYIYREN